MKSRASLVLMEQLMMVLIFALAAAVCLQIFAGADALSRRTARRDEAVLLAQNAAEQLKAGREPETVQGEYLLEIQQEDSGIPGLEQAQITVFWGEESLFALPVGYREVGT